MIIERLPRQPRGLRRLFDRRPPKAMVAKHRHRGVKNAVTGAHLTILTKIDEVSNDEGVRRGGRFVWFKIENDAARRTSASIRIAGHPSPVPVENPVPNPVSGCLARPRLHL